MRQDKIGKVLDAVRARYADYQFTVVELAREVGMSSSHLREIVELECGIGPGRLIETVRLEAAVDFISNDNSNLYSICRKVGYQNTRTFRKVFHKRLGMAPSECKRRLSEGAQSLDALKELLKDKDVNKSSVD